MFRSILFALATSMVITMSAVSQTAIAPEYGSLAASPDAIVFTANVSTGDLVYLDLESNNGSIALDVLPEDTGAIGYISGMDWLFGMTSDSSTNAGDVLIFDAGTSTLGEPITNLTDVRDLAVLDQGGQFDAIVVNRENDTVHLIADILGTPASSDITPSAIAGNVDIQGLVALSYSLYFLYDQSPEGGFGSDELIVVDGDSTDATATRISWNEIGSAGAGLTTDELSVDFHNGMAVHQPDDSTINMYLSNFGNFSNNQIIQVTWTDSGNGFDFASPMTSVLFTENDLFFGISENNSETAEEPVSFMNARGVAIVPGETAADDQLLLWIDDNENGNTYMLLYHLADETFTVVGGDALERIIDPTSKVSDWMRR